MRFALEVWSSSFEQIESTCLLAEALGIDAFYYGESPHDLNLDCWTTLAALAKSTERIRLGPVITNVLPDYRSAALLAKQAATVDAISKGRLDFRTGVGASALFGRPWWEPFGVEYPGYEQRLAYLEEAVPSLRSSGVPLTIAARAPRAMALAAQYADVWETSFCTPGEFAEQSARMASLLGERSIVRSLEVDAFVASTKHGVERLLQRVNAERGSAEDLAPVFDRAVVGVPDDAAGRLIELAAVGVDQVVVALHDPHDVEALTAIAETARLVSSAACAEMANEEK